MRIIIKTKDGKKIGIQINPREEIVKIKNIIKENENIPVNQQLLIFEGEILKDDDLLDKYDLENGSTILLVNTTESLKSKLKDILKIKIEKENVDDLLNEALSYFDEKIDDKVAKELFKFINSCFSKFPDQCFKILDQRLQKEEISSFHLIITAFILQKHMKQFNTAVLFDNYTDFISKSIQDILSQSKDAPGKALNVLGFQIPPQYKYDFITDIVLLSPITKDIVTQLSDFFFSDSIEEGKLETYIAILKKVTDSELFDTIPEQTFIKNNLFLEFSTDIILHFITRSSDQIFKNIYSLVANKFTREDEINSSFSDTFVNKCINNKLKLENTGIFLNTFTQFKNRPFFDYLIDFDIKVPKKIITEKQYIQILFGFILEEQDVAKNKKLYKLLFNFLMSYENTSTKHILIQLERYTNNLILDPKIMLDCLGDLYNEHKDDFVYVLKTFYAFSQKNNFFVRNLDAKDTKEMELPFIKFLSDFKYDNYEQFIFLQNIISTFPFIINELLDSNDESDGIPKFLSISLPHLDCFATFFEENETTAKLNELKLAASVMSFLFSCLYSTEFLSIFVPWLFENYKELSESKVIFMTHILLSLFQTRVINRIVLAYAIKSNFLEIISKLLDNEIKKDPFKDYYYNILYELSSKFIDLSTGPCKFDDCFFINQLRKDKIENPFVTEFNGSKIISDIVIKPINIAFKHENNYTKKITAFLNEIGEAQPYWIYYSKPKSNITTTTAAGSGAKTAGFGTASPTAGSGAKTTTGFGTAGSGAKTAGTTAGYGAKATTGFGTAGTTGTTAGSGAKATTGFGTAGTTASTTAGSGAKTAGTTSGFGTKAATGFGTAGTTGTTAGFGTKAATGFGAAGTAASPTAGSGAKAAGTTAGFGTKATTGFGTAGTAAAPTAGFGAKATTGFGTAGTTASTTAGSGTKATTGFGTKAATGFGTAGTTAGLGAKAAGTTTSAFGTKTTTGFNASKAPSVSSLSDFLKQFTEDKSLINEAKLQIPSAISVKMQRYLQSEPKWVMHYVNNSNSHIPILGNQQNKLDEVAKKLNMIEKKAKSKEDDDNVPYKLCEAKLINLPYYIENARGGNSLAKIYRQNAFNKELYWQLKLFPKLQPSFYDLIDKIIKNKEGYGKYFDIYHYIKMGEYNLITSKILFERLIFIISKNTDIEFSEALLYSCYVCLKDYQTFLPYCNDIDFRINQFKKDKASDIKPIFSNIEYVAFIEGSKPSRFQSEEPLSLKIFYSQSIDQDLSKDRKDKLLLNNESEDLRRSSPFFRYGIYERYREFLSQSIVDKLLNFDNSNFLREYFELVPFSVRLATFKSNIRKIARPGTKVNLKVQRKNIIEESFNELLLKNPKDLLGDFKVDFIGESGIDAGGLTKEWFTVIIRELFNPNCALVMKCSDGTYHPNPSSKTVYKDYKNQHIDYFRIAGEIIALALIRGQCVAAHLSKAFLRQILHQNINFNDLKGFDDVIFNSMEYTRNIEDVEDLDMTFSINDDNLGDHETNELYKGGADDKVTNENRDLYVALYTEYRLRRQVIDQINAFCSGFNALIPADYIKYFTPAELGLMICGVGKIDVKDFQDHARYRSPYKKDHQTIQMFFRVISRWNQENLSKLLQFITGTSHVPVNGFKDFEEEGNPITITHVSDKEKLPTAHTCFNTLDLPNYDNEESMNDKLLKAVNECNSFGFG